MRNFHAGVIGLVSKRVARARTIVKEEGLPVLLGMTVSVIRQLIHAPRHRRVVKRCQALVRNAVGLEIGGPSPVFGQDGILPLYHLVSRLDNCTFSPETIWEGRLAAGQTFVFDKTRPAGEQMFAEGTDLSILPSGSYDFVISSHMLEHSANPIRALSEWLRVVRDDGALIVVLPSPKKTFDHRRPATPLAHLVDDYEKGTGEDDLSHLPEILALHDLSRDPGAGNFDSFRERSMLNARNRCLHHHVFDLRTAAEIAAFVGIRLYAVEEPSPVDIVVVGTKPPRRVNGCEEHNDSR